MANRLSMEAAQLSRRVKNKLRPPAPLFKLMNRGKQKFQCPICAYEGPFMDVTAFAGVRRHAQCPKCGSLERHRLQYLALLHVLRNTDRMQAMLHFAPESFLKGLFAKFFSVYETADLFMKDVDHRVDIQHLPFEDGSYDLVFASHVLEHIRDDRQALAEIRRVLRPNGLAILPVPIVCQTTIEYPAPNPYEAGHVRAPGIDYFERYKEYFSQVHVMTSESFPGSHQLFIYEDRTRWPTKECPLRPPMGGLSHADYVPLCYA